MKQSLPDCPFTPVLAAADNFRPKALLAFMTAAGALLAILQPPSVIKEELPLFFFALAHSRHTITSVSYAVSFTVSDCGLPAGQPHDVSSARQEQLLSASSMKLLR